MFKSLCLSGLAGALLLLPTVSSAQTLPSAPPAPDSGATATIVFYRLRDAYAALLKPSIYCDGQPVARMRNGRFVTKTVAPGAHTITSTFAGSGISAELKPGETYYVRVDMSKPAMFHNARGQVTEVTPGQGKFESSKLKPAEPEDLGSGDASTQPAAKNP